MLANLRARPGLSLSVVVHVTLSNNLSQLKARVEPEPEPKVKLKAQNAQSCFNSNVNRYFRLKTANSSSDLLCFFILQKEK